MTFAISDIHGCSRALEVLLALLPVSEEDLVVCLGDYIDRGNDSKRVVELLLSYREEHQMVHLIGNHELFLRDALACEDKLAFFKSDIVGGAETLKSYGGVERIPDLHKDFLLAESLPYFETESAIFVHGGIEEDVLMGNQGLDVLAWKRVHQAQAHISGKMVVCGHTIVGDLPLLVGGHTVGIDTGAGKGGWITALAVEAGKYYQANEEGESREGLLSPWV